ncbi:hypothetical protein [Mesorhizobium sp. M1121]|uniref:hypothetical protein n=1 Tax=Mesorhizobium sp. M1121 TaxID=2957058 RepID=UPI0033379A0C
MADDASAAGFNPLTAIRNGGSAGFTSTTSPGSGGLSAALSTAGNFLQNFDPFADAKREQESRYVEAQINNLNAQSGSYNRTASTPSGPVLRRSGAASLSMQSPPTPGKTTVTNPLPGPGVVDSRLVDADAWEARYSDLGGWVGGAINAFGDLSENIARPFGKTPLTDAWEAVNRPFRAGKKVPLSGNMPAGNDFQLPAMWPTYGAGPLGGY